ncbi:MAG TPA: class II fumarate hydratase, partial [Candidatus Aenigmarchaeota archaeon]|nr:class II fumarate hydratase [Candidatus Aenigmarchaeota archaeon]
LADACTSLTEKALNGIEANKKNIKMNLENSLMLVTALNKHIGYDKAAEIALKAWREDKMLKEAALELGYLNEKQFAEWVRPEEMTSPEEL